MIFETEDAVHGHRYLSGKILEGDAHNITCPGYDCDKLVPVELIETVVSRDMARRYLQFDIKVNRPCFLSVIMIVTL